MAGYHFQREYRTPYSEGYTITSDDAPVGKVDLHYTWSVVYATLCVNEGLTEEGVQELIRSIDDELVMSVDPNRDDFVVTVFQGRELGVYSQEDWEEEAENGGNGSQWEE